MSSPFRQALLALMVVAIAAALMDYRYLTVEDAVPAPIPLAAAHETAPPTHKLLSVPQGPVGPIPGPPAAGQDEVANPYADDPESLRNGRRMFVTFNCAGCHGTHAGGGMGPSLRDESWMYGNAPADIFDSIAAGRAHGMPAWGAMLPPKQIWQIVAYIQSLRTPQEPEPPQ